MNRWSDSFVAVDWGTTNRRAYLVERGRVVDSCEDDDGVLSVPGDGFAGSVEALRDRFGGRPLLLAGMVGSDRGWRVAPYVACPASLEDVAAKLCWADPGRTAIVPGLSFLDAERADVMRGEEVQIFGVQALRGGAAAAICHPGTHTKWIVAEGGRLVSFRTIMTGELFSLLKQHSILAGLLQTPVEIGDAFFGGVERGFAEGALGTELFAIRARVLLEQADAADAASFASGLMIGCDLRIGLASSEMAEILVVGRPSLTRLYAAAIRRCGRTASEIDGAEAFVAGMTALAETIA